MKLTSLFSGSSGNCILVEHEGCTLLVDAGCSARSIQRELSAADCDIEAIDAILVTHEHSDHISGLGVISRKIKKPVYLNRGTYEALLSKPDHPSEDLIKIFKTGENFCIKDIEITPFATSHDAAEPVGYRFDCALSAVAVATDTGMVQPELLSRICGCRSVLLESNHDVDMLMHGAYPAYLKQRILSEHGHLSNDDAAKALAFLIENGTEHICLGHLSKENNTPLIALNTAVRALSDMGFKKNSDYTINVARRDGITDSLEN